MVILIVLLNDCYKLFRSFLTLVFSKDFLTFLVPVDTLWEYNTADHMNIKI